MEFKYPIIGMIVMALSGCHVSSQRSLYAEGYRAAAKEEIKNIEGQFQGGKFPYYHWAAPLVQEVVVPAHISNGVFIPEHKELVIIKPGEWVNNAAYPIQSQEENYEEEIKSTSGHTADITPVPNS